MAESRIIDGVLTEALYVELGWLYVLRLTELATGAVKITVTGNPGIREIFREFEGVPEMLEGYVLVHSQTYPDPHMELGAGAEECVYARPGDTHPHPLFGTADQIIS